MPRALLKAMSLLKTLQLLSLSLVHFLRKSAPYCHFRNTLPSLTTGCIRSRVSLTWRAPRRGRLVSPADRITGGNRNPVGHSSRFVINERAPGSLESLPAVVSTFMADLAGRYRESG